METVQQDQAQEIFKLTFLRTSLGPDRPATSDARLLPQNEIHELPCEPHFLVYSKTAPDRTAHAYFTPYKWLPIGEKFFASLSELFTRGCVSVPHGVPASGGARRSGVQSLKEGLVRAEYARRAPTGSDP